MSILVVDTGLCNLGSVVRAIEECGGECFISSSSDSIKDASKIVLPGVGSFADAMQQLNKGGWTDAIRQAVLQDGLPILGICLGMQILATSGVEGGGAEGLNLIPGEVVRLTVDKTHGLRIPHVGWNELHQRQPDALFEGVPDQSDFYFVHSFHFVPKDKKHILAVTDYGVDVVAVVGNGTIWGTQFHPEKSGRRGFEILQNFLKV